MKNKQQGFTLIEIMVVVVILGILATLIVPKIMGTPDQAKMVKEKQDILAIQSALQLYKLDNGIYPSTEQGLLALITKPSIPPVPEHWKQGGYLQQLPLDPWSHAYQYLNPGKHGEIDIFTEGAGGQPQGEGINAEVGNWQLNQ